MSKSHPRNRAPEGLVNPEHRYKHDAKTRAAMALAAKILLSPGKPRQEIKKTRRAKGVPRPLRERQSLEQERAELRKQVAAYTNELAITVGVNKARREPLDWQIQRAQKRLTDVEAMLGVIRYQEPTSE